MRGTPSLKHSGSYAGLIDPAEIHASSTSLDHSVWPRDIIVNEDSVTAGFRLPKTRAFQELIIVANIGRERGSFGYSVDGGGEIPVKVMRPWDFILVPAGVKWGWNVHTNSQILLIRLQSGILSDTELRPEFGTGRHGCRFPKIVEIAEALKGELEQPTRFTPKAVDAHRTLLAIALARQFAVRGKPVPPPVPGFNEGDIAAAIALIESWVESPDGAQHPTLEALANKAHMSTRSLRRHFQRVTENSPIEFMVRRAMEKAAILLAQSHPGTHAARVQRVASLFGYHDSDFTHNFKKYNGGRAPRTFLPRG